MATNDDDEDKTPNEIFRKSWLDGLEKGHFKPEHEAIFYHGAAVALHAALADYQQKDSIVVRNRVLLLVDEIRRHSVEKTIGQKACTRCGAPISLDGPVGLAEVIIHVLKNAKEPTDYLCLNCRAYDYAARGKDGS
jgi:hypothetical protein